MIEIIITVFAVPTVGLLIKLTNDITTVKNDVKWIKQFCPNCPEKEK